jgi:hypothetical protein
VSDLKLALKRFLAVETGQDSIHYTRAPTKTSPPYGVISIISNRRERTHDGRDGLAEARVQIDWFTKTDSESEQLSSATIEAVEKVQNETIGVRRGKGGIFIAQVTIETEFDDYEDDTGLFHKAIDLTIQYEED